MNPSDRIRKDAATRRGPPPNMPDWEAAARSFSWEAAARAGLSGLGGGALNIAHEAVDRHAAGPLRDRAAFRFVGKDGVTTSVTWGELKERTNRFANVLRARGIKKGDRVFALTGRIPETAVVALGAMKLGAVFCPLFTAFGPEPIRARLTIGGARVLVTTDALFHKKVAPLLPWPAPLDVLVIGGGEWEAPMAAASDRFEVERTSPEDLALLHFTSGTTGKPKGAMHVHAAVLAHHVTGQIALDFHPDDVFWCTADPGWVTGTSYGILSPLTNGVTSVVDEGEFDAARWYRILAEHKVSVWYTAPTAVRMMMKAGAELAREYDTSSLRFIASVGEPLNPEGVTWGLEAFGLPIHDNWWQTETGGILLANFAGMDIKPGSMGRPLPGIEAGVVRRTPNGGVEEVPRGEEGELALKPGWPSMFRGYLGDEERYRKCFAGGWYLTGDLARVDDEGYFWFVGRADDVIKSAGHLIGPFEVESALMEHPAVAEAGVIGKPDPVIHESVKAFVSLKPAFKADEALRRELLGFARVRLGAAVAPREIAFVDTLPRTRSGKIMRRLLKARELGLPEGDLSTLEAGA